MMVDMDAYLKSTALINCNHPDLQACAQQFAHYDTPTEQAIAIYYWVRDEIRYNPYVFGPDETHMRADLTIKTGESWCVPKAILMAALCRASHIPAGVGFADVRNHLSTERLRARMKTDVFYYHGYCTVFLNDQWVKATPAFNAGLCHKFGLKTLEFDGAEDSLYHPFDLTGQRHMEYIRDHGHFDDVPVRALYDCFAREYGTMLDTVAPDHQAWDDDVAREIKN